MWGSINEEWFARIIQFFVYRFTTFFKALAIFEKLSCCFTSKCKQNKYILEYIG